MNPDGAYTQTQTGGGYDEGLAGVYQLDTSGLPYFDETALATRLAGLAAGRDAVASLAAAVSHYGACQGAMANAGGMTTEDCELLRRALLAVAQAADGLARAAQPAGGIRPEPDQLRGMAGHCRTAAATAAAWADTTSPAAPAPEVSAVPEATGMVTYLDADFDARLDVSAAPVFDAETTRRLLTGTLESAGEWNTTTDPLITAVVARIAEYRAGLDECLWMLKGIGSKPFAELAAIAKTLLVAVGNAAVQLRMAVGSREATTFLTEMLESPCTAGAAAIAGWVPSVDLPVAPDEGEGEGEGDGAGGWYDVSLDTDASDSDSDSDTDSDDYYPDGRDGTEKRQAG
jgi:hypothetical protein